MTDIRHFLSLVKTATGERPWMHDLSADKVRWIQRGHLPIDFDSTCFSEPSHSCPREFKPGSWSTNPGFLAFRGLTASLPTKNYLMCNEWG